MNILAKIMEWQQEIECKPGKYNVFCGCCSRRMEEKNKMLFRLQALGIVAEERDRQIQLWGDVYFKDLHEGICVLGEEYGELCEAVNETLFDTKKKPELGGKENIIKEASHVAAVAIKMIEMLLEDEDSDMKP